MTDVIVQLPVTLGEEARAFGAYLSRFMAQRTVEAEAMAATADAPYIMVQSSPAIDAEIKVLTFQERAAAAAFSTGWAKARQDLGPAS